MTNRGGEGANREEGEGESHFESSLFGLASSRSWRLRAREYNNPDITNPNGSNRDEKANSRKENDPTRVCIINIAITSTGAR
jgi:hypothetical protein